MTQQALHKQNAHRITESQTDKLLVISFFRRSEKPRKKFSAQSVKITLFFRIP